MVNTQCHEQCIDKTIDTTGTLQDLLLVCEQVQVHRAAQELHSERGVEGQVIEAGLGLDIQDLGRHRCYAHGRHRELHAQCRGCQHMQGAAVD